MDGNLLAYTTHFYSQSPVGWHAGRSACLEGQVRTLVKTDCYGNDQVIIPNVKEYKKKASECLRLGAFFKMALHKAGEFLCVFLCPPRYVSNKVNLYFLLRSAARRSNNNALSYITTAAHRKKLFLE